ncbi:MAG: GNAT family protein [Spirosomataceae bacterium]
MSLQLLPIGADLESNQRFRQHPYNQEVLEQTIAFFARIGYQPPWTGYFVELDEQLVGSAAFKGAPVNGKVEIAYGVEPEHQQKGIGTQICRALVELSLRTDPSVRVTARTLPELNFSARLLQKNGFVLLGTVWDDEDGDVWEWEYIQTSPIS